MTDTCPVCKTEMAPDTQCGPWCPNDACPVEDDSLLWYQTSAGEWKVQHWITGPWRDDPNGGRRADMWLSEKEA